MRFKYHVIILSTFLIPLISSRTPDETSAPSIHSEVYQSLSPPSTVNTNLETINLNQDSSDSNFHPYRHQTNGLNQIENNNNNPEQSNNNKNDENVENQAGEQNGGQIEENVDEQNGREIYVSSTQQSVASSGCFHRGREDCPKITDKCRCKQLVDNSAGVVCCDVTEFLLKEGLGCAKVGITDNVTELHIRNATLPELNFTLMNFRRLKSLSITDGRIQKVVGKFLALTPIQCLNLSSNGLQGIETRAVTPLRHLNTLDLSHNNLTVVPNLNQRASILLDISGNNEMPCQNLLNVRNNYTFLDFENVNNTYCSISKNFNWFNSTELLPLKQVEEFFIAQNNCWPNCTCEFYRMDYVAGKVPTIAFKVDCSGKQLTEMPGELPKNTIVLNISNNNISVLKMDNESFGNIRELYADNNQIKSILDLEGTKFLDNFVALSLRNNSLKDLQSYMLSYIFDRNVNTRQVHFGLNRLKCDCSTAKTLRVWLLAKQKNILDYDDIYCENPNIKVIHLDPAAMCQDSTQSWTDYIYYIITTEVLLLVCLVLKVSYDYWIFKTEGRLPWPAHKMPKLPCDWLCE